MVTKHASQISGFIAKAPLPETEAALATLDRSVRKDAAARIAFDLKSVPVAIRITLSSP